MIVKSLYLNNFKNIEHAQLEFSPKINCLLGDNGMGKSNLLDALYFLSYCKSFVETTSAADSTKKYRPGYGRVRAKYSSEAARHISASPSTLAHFRLYCFRRPT